MLLVDRADRYIYCFKGFFARNSAREAERRERKKREVSFLVIMFC